MERRKKILYLLQLPPPVHGVSRINDQIYNSALIHANTDKYLVEIRFSKTLGQLRRFSFGKLRSFFNLCSELKATISSFRPDCIYFSIMPVGKGFWRDLILVRIIKKAGILPIYHLHNRGIAINAKRKVFRKLYRYVFNDSAIIHLSEGLLGTEILPLDLKNTRTYVLPNGCSVDQSTVEVKTRDIPTLLFVSNLFPVKGIYNLVEIMDELRSRDINANLKIVGVAMREKYEIKLLLLIEQSGLSDNIKLLGPKYGAELSNEYNTSDIFIFPSLFQQECAPLVILEAMQSGLPIVASKIGAIPEIIKNGKQGWLTDPEDLSGFTDHLERLIKSPDEREKLGLAAKERYEERYTIGHFEKNLSVILDDCIPERE